MSKPALLATLIALSTSFALAPVARAEATDDQRAAMKQKWESMTPEERAAAKEKMKAKWESMTPEEKKDFAQKHPQAARMAARHREGAASAPATTK